MSSSVPSSLASSSSSSRQSISSWSKSHSRSRRKMLVSSIFLCIFAISSVSASPKSLQPPPPRSPSSHEDAVITEAYGGDNSNYQSSHQQAPTYPPLPQQTQQVAPYPLQPQPIQQQATYQSASQPAKSVQPPPGSRSSSSREDSTESYGGDDGYDNDDFADAYSPGDAGYDSSYPSYGDSNSYQPPVSQSQRSPYGSNAPTPAPAPSQSYPSQQTYPQQQPQSYDPPKGNNYQYQYNYPAPPHQQPQQPPSYTQSPPPQHQQAPSYQPLPSQPQQQSYDPSKGGNNYQYQTPPQQQAPSYQPSQSQPQQQSYESPKAVNSYQYQYQSPPQQQAPSYTPSPSPPPSQQPTQNYNQQQAYRPSQTPSAYNQYSQGNNYQSGLPMDYHGFRPISDYRPQSSDQTFYQPGPPRYPQQPSYDHPKPIIAKPVIVNFVQSPTHQPQYNQAPPSPPPSPQPQNYNSQYQPLPPNSYSGPALPLNSYASPSASVPAAASSAPGNSYQGPSYPPAPRPAPLLPPQGNSYTPPPQPPQLPQPPKTSAPYQHPQQQQGNTYESPEQDADDDDDDEYGSSGLHVDGGHEYAASGYKASSNVPGYPELPKSPTATQYSNAGFGLDYARGKPYGGRWLSKPYGRKFLRRLPSLYGSPSYSEELDLSLPLTYGPPPPPDQLKNPLLAGYPPPNLKHPSFGSYGLASDIKPTIPADDDDLYRGPQLSLTPPKSLKGKVPDCPPDYLHSEDEHGYKPSASRLIPRIVKAPFVRAKRIYKALSFRQRKGKKPRARIFC